MTTDGATVYDSEGRALGTIHMSVRSRRWFYKHGRDLSPARFYDAEEAAVALRSVAAVQA